MKMVEISLEHYKRLVDELEILVHVGKVIMLFEEHMISRSQALMLITNAVFDKEIAKNIKETLKQA